MPHFVTANTVVLTRTTLPVAVLRGHPRKYFRPTRNGGSRRRPVEEVTFFERWGAVRETAT